VTYVFDFLPAALKEWSSLDKTVRERLHKKLIDRLTSPRNSASALSGELGGSYKIKDSKSGLRLVYQVEDEKLIVLVIAVDKRDKLSIYKQAAARLRDL